MPTIFDQVVADIRKREFASANELIKEALQQKVAVRLAEERKHLALTEDVTKVALIRDTETPVGQPGKMHLVCPHDKTEVAVPGDADVKCPKCGQKFDSRGYLKA